MDALHDTSYTSYTLRIAMPYVDVSLAHGCKKKLATPDYCLLVSVELDDGHLRRSNTGNNTRKISKFITRREVTRLGRFVVGCSFNVIGGSARLRR